MRTVEIRIQGMVQGVFYRRNTYDKARSLSINGTVENLSDGSVFVVASGPAEKIQELIDWCRQGPPRAIVHSIEVRDIPHRSLGEFTIIRQ